LAIDAKREGDRWTVMVRGGREFRKPRRDYLGKARSCLGPPAKFYLRPWIETGQRAVSDIALTAAISSAVSVPVICVRCAKLPGHFAEIFTAGCADAALAASIFHDNIQPIRELKEFLVAIASSRLLRARAHRFALAVKSMQGIRHGNLTGIRRAGQKFFELAMG